MIPLGILFTCLYLVLVLNNQPHKQTNKQTNKLKRCEPNVKLRVMTSSHRATHSREAESRAR